MRTVLAALAALSATFAMAAPAQAAGPFTYRNVSANQCLDVYKGQTTPGTPVQLYRCTGQAPQEWYRDEISSGGLFRFRPAVAQGLCIAPDGLDGSQVKLDLCRGEDHVWQYWERHAHADGSVSYENAWHNDLCLDAESGTGPRAILWKCDFKNPQRWR